MVAASGLQTPTVHSLGQEAWWLISAWVMGAQEQRKA